VTLVAFPEKNSTPSFCCVRIVLDWPMKCQESRTWRPGIGALQETVRAPKKIPYINALSARFLTGRLNFHWPRLLGDAIISKLVQRQCSAAEAEFFHRVSVRFKGVVWFSLQCDVHVREFEMTTHYRFPDRPEQAFSGKTRSRIGARHGAYRNGVKRVLDILLVLMGSVFVVPLVMVLAVLVARDGGRPFYCQDRVGMNGRIYRMWKLRSMDVDADEKLADYLATNPAARREWDHSQKLRCDPRITRIGHFLRRTSLDELPQLWNVFRGDMSLVGPRPMMPSQRALYPGDAYYALRPGITGLWQVSARNESGFAARASFDAEYDRTLSFTTDLKLLAATVRAVARGTGC
jgi:exopolysaccharide production protein ExoY